MQHLIRRKSWSFADTMEPRHGNRSEHSWQPIERLASQTELAVTTLQFLCSPGALPIEATRR